MAQYLRSELASLLTSYPAKLNTIASDMAVIRLIRAYRKAGALEAKALQYELMGRLISEAAALEGFMSVEIVTDKGESISRLPFSILSNELFVRIHQANEKFAFWVGQYRWGDLYPEASRSQRDKTVVLAARRILDYANVKLMGYILITLDCSALEKLLPTEAGVQLILSDMEGAVLASVGGDGTVSSFLASDLSANEPPDTLETSTLKGGEDWHLVITGRIANSPYRLTLAIPYSRMLSELNQKFAVILSLALCIVLVMLGLAWFITRSVTIPVAGLSRAMRRFGSGDFEARVSDPCQDEIGQLCDEFDEMANRVWSLTQKLREAQFNEKEAAYTALQAQINPHFLYNTLDMISWMGYGASHPDICKVVGSLSDFFRLSLNKGDENFTLQNEMDHVRSYICIQEYRMRKIHFFVEAPRELLGLRVPKLMVQPLVENAIQHGLKPRNYQGSVSVVCAREGNCLLIHVQDDGVGFDEAMLAQRTQNSTGYGIRNIRQRLALLYGDTGCLLIRNDPAGGTVVTLRLPVGKDAGGEKEVQGNENSHCG